MKGGDERFFAWLDGELAVWDAEHARAAAFLGHRETDIVNAAGHLSVERQPAQAGNGKAQGGGEFCRRPSAPRIDRPAFAAQQVERRRGEVVGHDDFHQVYDSILVPRLAGAHGDGDAPRLVQSADFGPKSTRYPVFTRRFPQGFPQFLRSGRHGTWRSDLIGAGRR